MSSTNLILGGLAAAVVGGAVYLAVRDDKDGKQDGASSGPPQQGTMPDDLWGRYQSCLVGKCSPSVLTALINELQSKGYPDHADMLQSLLAAIQSGNTPDEIASQSPGVDSDFFNPLGKVPEKDPCVEAAAADTKANQLYQSDWGSPDYYAAVAEYWYWQNLCDAKRLNLVQQAAGQVNVNGRRARTGACCASCAKGHDCEDTCQKH